jgi:hypothetical protein
MRKTARQYTIRNIPPGVDVVLRKRARDTGKSFNQVALDALVTGAGEPPKPKRDLREVVGSLTSNEAAKMDEEVRLQRQIDPGLWR